MPVCWRDRGEKKKSDAPSHDRKAAVSSVDGEEFQTLISNGHSGGICSHVREAGSCRNGSSSSVERVTDIGAEKKNSVKVAVR